MKVLQDYFVVLVDKIYESITTKSGILTSAAEHYLSNEEDKETDEHYAHKRQYGTVLTCPESFTQELVELIDPGLPAPKKFISGDYLQMRSNQGYSGYNKERSYYPSTFDEYESVTLADVAKKVKVNVGDRVYFNYMITEPENYLGDHQGMKMYKCRVDEIHCSVTHRRKVISGGGAKRPVFEIVTEIVPQGGWAMVIPDMETWEEITTPSGILRKPSPSAKYLRGIVAHVSPRSDIKPGSKVIYVRHADYVMTIEGRQYYVMQEDDILAKF